MVELSAPAEEPLPGPFVGPWAPTHAPPLPGSFLLPCPELKSAAELRAQGPSRLFPAAPSIFPWLEKAFAPGKATALLGPPALVSGLLPFLLASVSARGGEVSLRDGANRFSPYAIGALARRWGVGAEEVLGRIRLARAFTAHQMVTLAEGWGDALLSRHVLPSLLVAIDPTVLCLDAEVPPDESVALQVHLARLLGRLARSVRRPLLLTQERTGSGARLVFPGFPREGPPVQDTLRLLYGRDGVVLLSSERRNETLSLLAVAPHQRHLEEFDEEAPTGPMTLSRPTEVTPWDGLFRPTAMR